MLELSAAAREIDLKYMDESGFCAWEARLEKYTQPYLGVYLLGRSDLGVRAECIFLRQIAWSETLLQLLLPRSTKTLRAE